MSFQPPGSLLDEVHDLTSVCLDGEASPAEVLRLNTILLSDRAARRVYAHAIRDAYRLRRWAMIDVEPVDDMFNAGDSDAGFLRLASADSNAVQLSTLGSSSLPIALGLPAQPSSSLFAFGGSMFSYAVASVLMGMMLLVFWAMPFPFNKEIAKAPLPAGPSVQENLLPEKQTKWVGQIAGMTDCRWADPDTRAYVGSSVSVGRRYALSSGLLEISYLSGAKVILEGPCSYEVDSSAGGYLERGKLTARVDNAKPQAANPESRTPNPKLLFSVRTPTAVVTDLGTEFGVELDHNGVLNSYVFEGSVKIEVLDGENQNKRSFRVGKGESITVSSDAEPTVRRDGEALQSSLFARRMPRRIAVKTFNTGVSLGVGDRDPHWLVVARSDAPKIDPFQASVVAFPPKLALANDPSESQWISLSPALKCADRVVYTFRTTFDLSGMAPATAVLQGYFIADDYVKAIRLNGQSIKVLPNYPHKPFVRWCPFRAYAGFVEGENVLEFDVVNEHPARKQMNELGLRVKMEATCREASSAAYGEKQKKKNTLNANHN